MGRLKRHLRIYSIIINVDEKKFHFDFDLNEKKIDTLKEWSKKMGKIKLLFDNKNMKNIEIVGTHLVPNSNLDSESNDEKLEKINDSTKINILNTSEDKSVHKDIGNVLDNENSFLNWQSFYDADDINDMECQLELDDIETSNELNYLFL